MLAAVHQEEGNVPKTLRIAKGLALEVLVHDKRWRPSSMIVWGGGLSRLGTVVHLPGRIGRYGCSTGATAACDRRPKPPTLCAWTWSFGGPRGGKVHLCRRCFPGGRPARKFRPPAGWLRYWWPTKRRRELITEPGRGLVRASEALFS